MRKIENMVVKMVEKILESELDVKKFDRGNQRAGLRIRKVMQQIRAMAHEIRTEIQIIKKYRKKSNVKKIDT